MLPKWHILFGFLFAYIIYWFSSITIFQASLIFFASFLIDLDHYFRYVIKTKKINIFNFWKGSMEREIRWKKLPKKEKLRYKQAIFVFHGIEFFILLFFIYFIFPLIS